MAVAEKATRQYEVSPLSKEDNSQWFSQLKDPTYRRKLLRWVWLPCAFFSLGLVVAQAGPTILDLEIITNTDKVMGSFYFTSNAGGYLLGSFAAGAVHGKMNNNIPMIAATVMGGALTVASPYCSRFISMLCIRGVTGFFWGIIDCSANAEHMHIWGNEGQGLLQFLHFSFAIGGVVGPLFSAPFLAEEENRTLDEASPNTTLSPTGNDSGNTSSTRHHTTDVHYAFLISGTIFALTAVPFVVMLFCKQSAAADSKHTEDRATRHTPVGLHVFMISILCVYYVTYTCIENTFGSFLETFLVSEYKQVSKEQAAYITTFYWAAFAAGRFSGIFTSKCLIAVRLLYMHFCLMAVAFTGFLVSSLYGELQAMTAFTCLIGVALSSVYPAGFSWTEAETMKVTGRISGVILVGSSTGSMINPYIMGYLMDKSNFWFCYFLMGSVVATISLFLFLLCLNRFYVNPTYGKLYQSPLDSKFGQSQLDDKNISMQEKQV